MNKCNTVFLKLWNFSGRFQFNLRIFASTLTVGTEEYTPGIIYKVNDAKILQIKTTTIAASLDVLRLQITYVESFNWR